MKVFALLLVLATGCLDTAPVKDITVTGTVTDSSTGAPIAGAGVQVLFGICINSCFFQGSPGTGPTDANGKYAVTITGPSGNCGGYAYYVKVNAGSGYTPGDKGFACDTPNAQLDSALQQLKQYSISGTITLASSGSGVQGATVMVGLYPTGTSCLSSTSCPGTWSDSTTAVPGGFYALAFHGIFSAADCTGQDYLVTVRAGSGFSGSEKHVACGSLTSQVDFSLPP